MQSDNEKYNSFVSRSSERLENDMSILNKLKPVKAEMNKFLSRHCATDFRNYEKKFENIEKNILNLCARLKKNDFEVIFIGAEKSGKSSLITSFLHCPNLLPTGVGRCTYTAIEILTGNEADEETIVIEYFNRDEFENILYINKLNLEKCDQTNKSLLIVLQAEQKELHDCLDNKIFRELLTKEKEIEKFKKGDLDGVKSFLMEKTANQTNVKLSRALKKITLYTTMFATKNVSIYDLPGYDSPTRIHKDLAITRSQTADVIVYVKDCLRPSLPLHEIEMLDTLKNVDQLIPFEEKLIVVLTNVDRVNSMDDYEKTLEISGNEWAKYRLLANHLLVVSNEFENNKAKLQALGINSNGIDLLEQRISDCKHESRLKSLQPKVTTVHLAFKQLLQEFIQFAQVSFPYHDDINDPKHFLTSFETQHERAKAEWWNLEWKRILEKFSKYYRTIVSQPINSVNSNDNFSSFKTKYQELVDAMFKGISEKYLTNQPDRLMSIFDAQVEAGGVIATGEGHVAIRKELSEVFYLNLASMLSDELGKKVWETISKMLNWILQEMYCIKEIKEELLRDTEANAQRIIIQQIETLILRIARPAVELFIRFPRHDGRVECLKRFGNEVLVLDMFYKANGGERFVPKGLAWYLLTGRFKIDAGQTMPPAPGVIPQPNKPTANTPANVASPATYQQYLSLDVEILKEKALQENSRVFEITQSFDEVRQQIKSDLSAFQDYMKFSIFYGSGLEAFFQSELDKLKKRFFASEKDGDCWRIHVYREIEAGNPNIPFKLNKKDVKERQEIAKSLRDLKDQIKYI